MKSNSLSRLVIIPFTLIAALLLAACDDHSSNSASPEMEESKTRPNIIFILVDDMGFGDIGYNGSEIATPNLDQMAATGMKLDRNYVYPVCSPTRAALLSGQNPLDMGIEGPIDDHSSLPTDLKIMPEYFKELGYNTHMIGKWHLGLSKTSSWPSSKGFDSYYGFLGGWIDFYTHVFAGGLDWQRDGVSIREEGHATDLMTDEALRIIEGSSNVEPFLMYLAYNSPHSPLQHPPVYSGLNDFSETSDRSVYAEMVTHTDSNIGRLFESLEAKGILEDTIVIFSSDNGGAENLGADNGDLRGGKRSTLEGGIRVPGIISWANHIRAGTVLEQPIVVHDWLPTIIEAVGANPDMLAASYGQSMWAAIKNGAKVDRDIDIIGATGNLAVFDWPWKLIAIEGPGNDGTSYQLYRVTEDPYEENDLAGNFPEIVNRLTAEINAMPEPEFSRLEPEFNNSPRYYPGGVPTWDLRHEESRQPWAEAAAHD